MAGKKSITGKLRALMPDCQDVTLLIVKHQETRISFGEKLKMFFHIYVVCKFCKLFFKQSGALHRHVHNLARPKDHEQISYSLSAQEKETMQAVIQRHLKEN